MGGHGIEFLVSDPSVPENFLDVHGPSKFGPWSPHLPRKTGYVLRWVKFCKFSDFCDNGRNNNDVFQLQIVHQPLFSS